MALDDSKLNSLSLWQKALLFSTAYFLCAEIGSRLSAAGGTSVSFWLPAGLFVAVLLLNRTRDWPWFLLAAFPANLIFDLLHDPKPDFAVIFFFCCANVIQSVTGAWLVRRFVAECPTLATLKEFIGLVGFAAIFSTIFGAVIGAATLVHFGLSQSFEQSWEIWWGSNAMAILLLTPFILAWFSSPGTVWNHFDSQKKIVEACLLLAGLCAYVWVMMFHDNGIMSQHRFYLIPFLLWAGLRFGARGATAASLFLCMMLAFFTVQFSCGLTPQQAASGDYIFMLQGLLAMANMVALVPAIIISERERTLAELRESEERFKNLSAAAFEGIFISENGRILDVNEQGLKMFGYERGEMIGIQIIELVTPEWRDTVAERIRAGQETIYGHQLLRKDGSTFSGEAQAKMVRVGERTLRMTALRDITERKFAEDALMQSEERFSLMFKNSPLPVALIRLADGVILDVNESFLRMAGYAREETIGHTALELKFYPDPGRREFIMDQLHRHGYLHGHEQLFREKSGKIRNHVLWFDVISISGEKHTLVTALDITHRKRAEELTQMQMQVLEMLTGGKSLSEALDALLRLIESLSPEMLCSILLLDADGMHVRHGAAPSLPADYLKAIDGAAIGPRAGSCGMAAFERKAVFVADIENDPLWTDYKQFALPYGLRACWSTPIFDEQKNVLGTFAIYCRQTGLPDEWHQRLIAMATHTAAICIIKHRIETERQQAVSREHQARVEYTFQLIASQEAERARIARELHDSLGQNLLLIKNRAQLEMAKSKMSAKLREEFQSINDITSQAIAEIRQISRDLHPPQLDILGLTRALQSLIDSADESSKIAITGKFDSVDDVILCEAATNVYRIVQESLNNILKHSRAKKARVTLERDVHEVQLRIEDDGCGFKTSENGNAGKGIGLKNIAERVKMLGGKMKLDSKPDKGTHIEITIPISAEQQ